MRNPLVLKKGMQIWNRDGYLDILVSYNGNLVLCDMMELDDDGNLLFAGQEWLDPRDLKTNAQIMALAIAWLIPLCLLIGWGLSM